MGFIKKYTANNDFFERIDTQEKAYFLGLMYADGSISERSIVITLQENDRSILEKFQKTIEYTGKLQYINKAKQNSNWKNHWKLCIYSKKLVKDITNLGAGRNKTYNLSFPDIPKELYSHFIRGVFDGDGCIVKKETGYYFSITGNIKFLNDINNIISNILNIEPCVISRKNKNSELFGAIQYSKNSTLIKLRDFLYKDCKDLYIYRKFSKFYEIEERIEPKCKICGAKHEANGYCKRCYMRLYCKKKKRNKEINEKIIFYKNIKTNEKIQFDSISEASYYFNTSYINIWNKLKTKQHRKDIFSYNFIN